MKKIIILIISLLMFSCGKSGRNSSGNNGFETYIFNNTISVNSSKYYNFTHPSLNISCGPGANCHAIAFNGKIGNDGYIGFGAKYKNPNLSPSNSAHQDYDLKSFSMKLYWMDSDLVEGAVIKDPTQFTIAIIKSQKRYSVTNSNLNITITKLAEDIYQLQFNAAMTVQNENNPVDALDINNGDSIIGQLYSR